VEGDKVTDTGVVKFFEVNGKPLGQIEVGSLPDMLVFTPNGQKLLVANEGEPTNTEYDLTEEDDDVEDFVDPEGSISIITLGPAFYLKPKIQAATVQTIDFTELNGLKEELLANGVRIIAPLVKLGEDDQGNDIMSAEPASVAQDLEPEYITISSDSKYAWVTLQENNAIAKIDINNAQLVEVWGLGTKDHSAEGNGFDASDKDDGINICNWPVSGMYQPDAIKVYKAGDKLYLITANEGDARDFEEKKCSKMDIAESLLEGNPDLQENENLGRLRVTTEFPAQTDEDGNYTNLVSFGGRSFSIWDTEGNLVFDSGDQFETIIADKFPEYFNTNHDDHKIDRRSDNSGSEPEDIVIGKIFGRIIAFISLERMGGVMAYDVTDPANVRFLDYVNNRNFDEPVIFEIPVLDDEGNPVLDDEGEPVIDEVYNPASGDLSTEGLVFIPGSASPNRQPLVVAANEISGTTTVFKVKVHPGKKNENRPVRRNRRNR
jgi:DNA-binding beta-propeller fold protein YncE